MSQAVLSSDLCPLCGEPNDCQLCTSAARKVPCWCTSVEIPAELLARVPPEFRNRNCICRRCVEQFQSGKNSFALTGIREQST